MQGLKLKLLSAEGLAFSASCHVRLGLEAGVCV